MICFKTIVVSPLEVVTYSRFWSTINDKHNTVICLKRQAAKQTQRGKRQKNRTRVESNLLQDFWQAIALYSVVSNDACSLNKMAIKWPFKIKPAKTYQ